MAKHHWYQKTNDKRVYDPKYAEFRQNVRKRDCHKCQWPNCTESKSHLLVVHHIRPWAKNPELRYDPDNGITICKKHHALTLHNETQFLALFLQLVERNKRDNNNN